MANCITCKTAIAGQAGSVSFKCPKCTKYELVRCAHCREISAKYNCPECGFEGPN